jgi:hypothetical protein
MHVILKARTRTIPEEIFENLRQRGGSWAVYENHTIGDPSFGSRKFFQFGDGCTYFIAPRQLPNTESQNNQHYEFVGTIDFSIDRVTLCPLPAPIRTIRPKNIYYELRRWSFKFLIPNELLDTSYQEILDALARKRSTAELKASQTKKPLSIFEFGLPFTQVLEPTIRNGLVLKFKNYCFLLVRTIPPTCFMRPNTNTPQPV